MTDGMIVFCLFGLGGVLEAATATADEGASSGMAILQCLMKLHEERRGVRMYLGQAQLQLPCERYWNQTWMASTSKNVLLKKKKGSMQMQTR